MPKVHKTCIYSKKSKVLIVKSHQTCIYSKKNQTSQTLCGTDWHRWIGFWFFWFFWAYAGLVIFHYQNFWFFLSIRRFCALLASKCWSFLSICSLVNLKSLKPANTQKNKHFDRKKLRTCIYSKKINILMPKAHKTCVYSKKIKSFDSEKSPSLHILKKIKKIKNQFIYASQSHIESEIFYFLFFILSICRLLIFEYMQVSWTWSPSNLQYSKKKNILIGKSPRTCIYSKKINILMPKVHKTCIYSKKSKVLIVKSHQTCICSKKSKKSKTNSSMPVSPT